MTPTRTRIRSTSVLSRDRVNERKEMMIKRILAAAVAALLFFAGPLAAATPDLFRLQGFLTDGLDVPIDGQVSMIIDLATLTGACVVALGGQRAGMFTENKKTRDQLWKLGKSDINREEHWRAQIVLKLRL